MTAVFNKGVVMKNAVFFLSLFSLSTALVGCGGGNSGAITGAGKRCSEDGAAYNPIPMDTGAQKVSMKSEDKQMPQGTYTYAGSQLYYYDSSTKTQIHLAEDANFKASKVCMRNLPVGSQSVVEENSIASKMSVKSNSSDFEVRKMIFSFDKNSITMITVDEKKGSFDTAEDVFKEKNSTLQFYKTSDTTYEARTSRKIGSARIDTIVFYTLKK